MAFKIPNATGKWGTASTWDSVTNTPTLHASTNISLSTSGIYSAVFTAPNTTNYCTGVLIYQANGAVGGSGIFTIVLQENGSDVGGGAGTVSLNIADMRAGWTYFRFTTPYQFTSTTAGYYRFRAYRGSTTNVPSFSADSSGSLFAFLAANSTKPIAVEYIVSVKERSFKLVRYALGLPI